MTTFHDHSIQWGLIMVAFIVFAIICNGIVISRDERVIKEKTGLDSSVVFFHFQGNGIRLYKTTDGNYWVVTGVFIPDAYKQQ